MSQEEYKINAKEIMLKLAKLQIEVDYLKSHLEPEEDKELEREIRMWEEAGVEDSADFFEKHNL